MFFSNALQTIVGRRRQKNFHFAFIFYVFGLIHTPASRIWRQRFFVTPNANIFWTSSSEKFTFLFFFLVFAAILTNIIYFFTPSCHFWQRLRKKNRRYAFLSRRRFLFCILRANFNESVLFDSLFCFFSDRLVFLLSDTFIHSPTSRILRRTRSVKTSKAY